MAEERDPRLLSAGQLIFHRRYSNAAYPFLGHIDAQAEQIAALQAEHARLTAALQTHRLMGVRHVGNEQYRASCMCGHLCTQDVDWFGAVENWQLHLHEAVLAARGGAESIT